jgi:hypothetical protein
MIVVAAVLRPEVRDVPRYKKKRVARLGWNRPLFPKFGAFIKLLRIDVFGKPSDHVVEQLREKAQTLGSGTVLEHEFGRACSGPQ